MIVLENVVSGLALALLVTTAAPGLQDVPANETPQQADLTENEGVPPIPTTKFVPLDSSMDDAEFLREQADAVTDLKAQAERAEAPLDRADRLLRAANLTLAYQVEPACSRRFLRIQQSSDSSERDRRARAALAEAGTLLERGSKALEQLEVSEGLQETDLADRRNKLRVLRAFGTALAAYLGPSSPSDEGVDARTAASELSPILEHPDSRIAAAAKFWQTCLRAQEDDPSPALARLEPALLEPARDARPYSFFARLLRCQLLAQEGHPATALSLLLQMEERCHQRWFPAPSIEPALRTVALLRLQILEEWHDRLSTDDNPAELKWCADRMRDIVEQSFGGDERDILRITPVIPIIVEVPAAKPATEDEPPADALPPGTD